MVHSALSLNGQIRMITELPSEHDIDILHSPAGRDNRDSMRHAVMDHLFLHTIPVRLQLIFMGTVIHLRRQGTSSYHDQQVPFLIEQHLHIFGKI